MNPLHRPWEIAIDPSNCGRAKRWFDRRQRAAQPAILWRNRLRAELSRKAREQMAEPARG